MFRGAGPVLAQNQGGGRAESVASPPVARPIHVPVTLRGPVTLETVVTTSLDAALWPKAFAAITRT